MIHVDFKVPAEHTLRGETFDAEMQIFHLHYDNKRIAIQSVLIRAEKNKYNDYLQEALKAFQKQYDENMSACGRRMRARRQLMTDFYLRMGANVTTPLVDYTTWADFSVHSDFIDFEQYHRDLKFEGGPWDPHHWDLIPTIHFYRYEGSLTEPRK